MDKSDVRIGCLTEKIVVISTEVKKLYTASLENHISVMVIQTIYADGSPLPPLRLVVICLEQKIMENWIHDNLSRAEVIAVSPTGYTNTSIALAWLDYFIKYTDAGPEAHCWRSAESARRLPIRASALPAVFAE